MYSLAARLGLCASFTSNKLLHLAHSAALSDLILYPCTSLLSFASPCLRAYRPLLLIRGLSRSIQSSTFLSFVSRRPCLLASLSSRPIFPKLQIPIITQRPLLYQLSPLPHQILNRQLAIPKYPQMIRYHMPISTGGTGYEHRAGVVAMFGYSVRGAVRAGRAGEC